MGEKERKKKMWEGDELRRKQEKSMRKRGEECLVEEKGRSKKKGKGVREW